ncbi:hypothetical protein BCF46_1895 [Litoreibacter meonggei]|uniref:Uncharacterized protein n=1 Tax=Litoreibacter meonggei TaxID=1049199 RepID=A0A497W672_9RHOB|nr:hypothetical protein [Litoreibacter meonggei]RLJ51680.1 hypothetical protein BCF46_1895 [Litoreibacter meonggei]
MAPKISNTKSRQFPVRVAIVSWIDLLGFGSQIGALGLNPLAEGADVAINRLRSFHEVVASCSKRNFPTLVINDGAVAFRDLSYRSQSTTYDFFKDSWKLFKAVSHKESQVGHPGPRMVTAIGFRRLGRGNAIRSSEDQFTSLLKRLKDGKITKEQAIYEARTIKKDFDIVPQLQANFAFSKAYVAESGGKKEGFEGPNWFVELKCFSGGKCQCFDFSSQFPWESKELGISTEFGKVREFRPHKGDGIYPPDFLNAEDIAKMLSSDPNVIASLRKHTKPNTSSRVKSS